MPTTSLAPTRKSKIKSPTERLRHAFYRSLPRHMRYSVESLEPRYLLSATPIVGPTPASGPNPATTGQLNEKTSDTTHAGTENTAITAAITNIIGQLSYLGQQIDKDSIGSTSVTSLQTNIPLLNESMSSINAADINPTLGNALFYDATNLDTAHQLFGGTTLTADIENGFTSVLGSTTTAIDSNTLASDLKTWLNHDLGTSDFNVADKSSANTLDLQISFTDTQATETPIDLGAAAQEFNLSLVQTSVNTDADVHVTRTLTFDLDANLSSINSAVQTYDATPNSANLSAMDTAATSAFSFHLDQTGDSGPNESVIVDQESGDNDGYLNEFGVGFGVMGAGDSTTETDGAYALGGTFDLALDTAFNFASTSYNSSQLPSAALTSGTSFYTVNPDAFVGTKVAPQVFDKDAFNVEKANSATWGEAVLILPVDVYDGATGQTASDPSYVAGLGEVTGTFTVSDSSLLSGLDPLVQASSTELASFARLNAADIVAMAENSSYLGGQIDSDQLTSSIPFVDLTQGAAYDFSTALQNAFVNLLRDSIIVGTATPTSYQNGVATADGFTSATSLSINLTYGTSSTATQYALNLSLGANNGRTTLAQLVTALNGSSSTNGTLAYALSHAGLSATALQFVSATNSSGVQVLELVSADPNASFTLYNLPLKGSTTPILDLGFPTVISVAAKSGVSFTDAVNNPIFQLPAFAVTSSSTINLANFLPTSYTTGAAFAVSVNGQSAVTVTIPNQAYLGEADFVGAVNTALQAAGLQDSTGEHGLLAQGVGTSTAFQLELYGAETLADGVTPLYSFALSSPGSSSRFSSLNLSTATASVPYLTLVTSQSPQTYANGVASATYTGATSLTVNVTVGGTTYNLNVSLGTDATRTSVTALAAALNASLDTALDGHSLAHSSIQFQAVASGTSQVLQLVTNSTSSLISLTNISADTGASALDLGLATSLIYVNPNVTNGLLLTANTDTTVTDFASSLQEAFNVAGVTSVAPQVSDNGTVSVISFTSASATGTPAFTLTSHGSSLTAILGTSQLVSSAIAMVSSSPAPNFSTIQGFATDLYNSNLGTTGNYHGIDLSAPVFNLNSLSPSTDSTAAAGSPAFTFHLSLTVGDLSTLNGETILPDLTGQTLTFGSAYDDVSNLASSDTVTVSRNDTLQFDFGINLIATPADTTNGILTTSVPITQAYTTYQLNSIGVIDLTTDTGTIYQITLPAGSYNSITGLLAAINAAILNPSSSNTAIPYTTILNGYSSSLGTPPALSTYLNSVTASVDANQVTSLVFTTKSGTTRELNVVVPANSGITQTASNAARSFLGFGASTAMTTTGTGANAVYALAGTDITPVGSSYVLPTSAFFTFTLPDGSTASLEVDPSDTAGATSVSSLVAAINNAIEATPALKALTYATVQAYVQNPTLDLGQYATVPVLLAEATSDGKGVQFVLNPAVYPSPLASGLVISTTTIANYQQPQVNGFAQDLGLLSGTVDTAQTATGLLSSTLPATFPTYAAGTTDSFDVSIDGVGYTLVTVHLGGVNSAAGFIAAVNSALKNTTVTFASDPTPVPLSDYLQANLTSSGTSIIIRLIDGGLVNDYKAAASTNPNIAVASAFPVLNNAALVLSSDSGALAGLGFNPTDAVNQSNANVPQELLFTMLGSSGTIGAAQFTGTATVSNAAFSGTGDFGFTTFDFGAPGSTTKYAHLNESYGVLTKFLTGTSASIEDVLINADAGSFSDLGSEGYTVTGSSYAVVDLQGLTFPNTGNTTVTNLAFGTNPYIVFGYGSDSLTINGGTVAYAGPAFVSNTSLPLILSTQVQYVNTNNMQLLTTLDSTSIAHALERVGDMVSDLTNNGQTGFDSKLIFILETLDGIHDVGQDFADEVAALISTPPASLEAMPDAISHALQLGAGALTFSLISAGTGVNASLVLNITFNWVEAFTAAESLAIDLSTLENDAIPNTFTSTSGTNQTYTAGLISQYLLQLSTVSSATSSNGSVTPITVNFSEVSQLAIDVDITAASGGVAITPQATVVSNGTPVLQTRFLVTGDNLNGDLPAGVNDLLLSNGSVVIDALGQSDQATNVLALATSSIGTYASATNTVTGSVALDGYVLSSSDVGNEVLLENQASAPAGLYVVGSYVAASATNVVAVGSTNAGAYNSTNHTVTGSAALDGHTITSADVGGYVLLENQSSGAPAGLYRITSDTAGTYVLTANQSLAQIAAAGEKFYVQNGTTYQGKYLLLNNATDTTFSIGSDGTYTLTPALSLAQIAASTGQYYVENGNTYLDQYVSLATPSATTFSLQTPYAYDTAAATSFSPTTVDVFAAATGNVGTYQTNGTLTGTGPLVLDGHTVTNHSLVLIDLQTNPSQNGLYQIAITGSGASQHWVLTKSTQSLANTDIYVQNGTVYGTKSFGVVSATHFGQLLEPATYSYGFATGVTSAALPYTVAVATTDDLGSGVGYNGSNLISEVGKGSINDYLTTDPAAENSTVDGVVGIDGVTDLQVGDLVLVKDQTAQDANGIYEVTTLGDSGTSFVLTRAAFASTPAQLKSIGVDVARGNENADTRWIMDNQSLTTVGSGTIYFHQSTNELYSTFGNIGVGTGYIPSFAATYTGNAAAILPLAIVATTTGGQQITIGNDLQLNGEVTNNISADPNNLSDLQKFYLALNAGITSSAQLGSTVVSASNGLVYSDFTPFKPLAFNLNLSAYVSGLADSNPGHPPTSVNFTYVPDLADSYIPSSVLAAFQNAFMVGDSLDLALFTIQSAVAEALAQEFPLVGTALGGEAEFIENFRSTFTSLVRQNILSNPLFPLADIRNAITDAAQSLLEALPGGYYNNIVPTGSSLVQVRVYDGSSFANYDFTNEGDQTYYGHNTNGYYEIVPTGTSSITFSLQLGENYLPGYNTTINAVDLGDSSIGGSISTSTTSGSSAGGILLERAFTFDFGFGIDSTSGFFIFNPVDVDSGSTTPTSMVEFGFKAELDGNIGGSAPANSSTLSSSNHITTFDSDTYSSSFNGLQVEVSDGRLLDQLNATADTFATPTSDLQGNDYLPSGFYGEALFTINDLHPVNELGANGNLSFVNGHYADLNDLRNVAELGADDSVTAPPQGGYVTGATSLFSFAVNADADVDLQLQSEQDGLQPATQADFIYAKTYGTGAAASFGLHFLNPAVVGLGNSTLGAEEIYDQENSTNTADQTDFENIATQVSPIWRFANRYSGSTTSLLVTNDSTGNSFVDYQNLKINIIDYLGHTLYSALRLYEEIVAPIRPFITFLTTPIPGTTAFTSGGITIGALLGSSFETFVDAVAAMDALISPLSGLAAEDTDGSGWVPATADAIDLSGLFDAAEYLGGKIADKLAKKKSDEKDGLAEQKGEKETKAEDTKASTAVDDNGEPVDKSTTASKKRAEDAEKDSDEKNKSSSTSAGLTGGAILLDALDFNTVTNLYLGVDTDLLEIQLPQLNVSYTYTKKIPIEAFPPLVITLGFTIGLQVNLSFGWDTNGFYFSTTDITNGNPLPAFSLSAGFTVGIGLDFGIVDIEASLTFTVTVAFEWNDVSGTGKLHESDIQYLQSHSDSIFAIEVTGTLEFDFSIVLDLFLFKITLFSYSWSTTLFDDTFLAVTGQMQLGTVLTGTDSDQDVLVLNSGIYAANRLFVDTNPVNENFTLYDLGTGTTGENILVDFDNEYYQEFSNIKYVVGYAGSGASTLDAGSSVTFQAGTSITLQNPTGGHSTTQAFNSTTTYHGLDEAVVNFFGGNGDTTLRAGLDYNPLWGRSRLQGGTGTGTEVLDASASAHAVDLIGGAGPAIIYGSGSQSSSITGGGDNIVAGQGPDLLYGSQNDNFYFSTGFGNDRIYLTGSGNSVSFSGYTLAVPGDTILTAAEQAQYLTPAAIGAINTALTLSFGPLVESAVSGDSTVFFATDPNEVQQINSWTGGVAGDTWDIYYFAPSQDLTLTAGNSSHANFFNLYFGNPNLVYATGASNQGRIQIDDGNARGQDTLEVTQLFAESVTELVDPNNSSDTEYENWSTVNSGPVAQRETLDFPTGLTVDYNAPNSTLFLGSVADAPTYDSHGNLLTAGTFYEVSQGTYNVGTIIQLSPLEFDVTNNTVVLSVKNTLEFKYDVNIVGSQASPASLTINVSNAFPTGISDLIVDAGAILGFSSTSRAGLAATSTTGLADLETFNGWGTMTLNLTSGSLTGAGAISLINGLVIITALTSIGSFDGTSYDPFIIVAGQLAAVTTSSTNPNNSGIFITSPETLTITESGTVIGLHATVGNIVIVMSPNVTLQYYKLQAGGDGTDEVAGNITIVADSVVALDNYDLQTQVPQTVTITDTTTYYLPFFEIGYFNIGAFGLFFPFPFLYVIEIPFTITTQYTEVEEVTENQYLGGNADNPDSISGPGVLTFKNATTGRNMTVGGTTDTSGDLFVSDDILATIATGFQNIVFGWMAGALETTGTLNLNATTFSQAPQVQFSGTAISVGGDVSDTYLNVLVPDSELDFYSTGTVNFNSHTISANTIYISAGGSFTLAGTFDAGNNYTNVDGSFTLLDTTGAIVIGANANINANYGTGTGVSSIFITGQSIELNSSAQMSASSEISLDATAGSIIQDSNTHFIKANVLQIAARDSVTLFTNALELAAVSTLGTISLTNDNRTQTQTNNGLVKIDLLSALQGNVILSNEGDINFHRTSLVYPNGTNPIIQTGSTGSVTVTALRGGIYGVTDYTTGLKDIVTDSLTLSAVTTITNSTGSTPNGQPTFFSLITDVQSLSATTTGSAGAISILNAGDLALGTVSTHSGAITIGATGNITVNGTVSSVLSGVGAAIVLDDTSFTAAYGHITVGSIGTVNAGTQNVTLNADSYISAPAGGLIEGGFASLTAFGDHPTTGPGATTSGANSDGSLINANLDVTTLDAIAEGTGNIVLTTSHDIYLQKVVTTAGSITVTGAGGTVDMTTLDLNSGSNDVTIHTTGTLLNNTTDTLYNDAISGNNVTTVSGGQTILQTDVLNYLNSTVTGAGALTVNQAGGFTVHATTTAGAIAIVAGTPGITDANILVDTITAGSATPGVYDNVAITSYGGSTSDLNAGILTGPSADTSLITASQLTLTNKYGTGVASGPNIPYLTTAVASLVDTTTGAQHALTIDQTGNILLSNIQSAGSNVVVDVTGNITVETLDIAPGNGATVADLDASGSVDQYLVANVQTGLLTANRLEVTAGTGINLLTDVIVVVNTNATTGNVTLANVNTTNADAVTSAVTIEEMSAAAGNITLTNVGDIDFGGTSTTTLVSTGSTGTTTLTSSAGGIYGDTVYTALPGLDIRTGTLALHAHNAIDNLHRSDPSTPWVYGLVVDAASISAISTTGAITILNIGAATLTDIETQEKTIALYSTGTLSVQGNVTTNNAGGTSLATILVDTHTFAQSGGSIDLGTSTLAGNINAGVADVTLLSDNAIVGALGQNLVTGSYLLAKSYGNAIGRAATDVLIQLKLAVSTVDAHGYGTGFVTLDTNQNLLLDDVTSYSGNITVTAEAALPSVTPVNLTTEVVDAGTGVLSNVSLTADGTITDSSAATPLESLATNNITADLLTTSSGGLSILKTNINTLDSHVGTTGTLLVHQDKALTIREAITNDGSITINAGEVTDVGNMFVGVITAGGTSPITLHALGGYIEDTTFDPTFHDANDNSLVTGGIFTATTATGIHGLETQVTEFDITAPDTNAYVPGGVVTIDQTGNVLVNHIDLASGGNINLVTHRLSPTNDGTITVNDLTTDVSTSVVNLTSIAGAIDQEVIGSAQIGKVNGATLNASAATGIDLVTNINLLNRGTVTGAGDIVFLQDHSLIIGQVQTPAGNFDLTLHTGNVVASNQPLAIPYNVEANDIDIIAPGASTRAGDAIGSLAQNLNVYADQFDANVTTGGGIYVTNFKTAHLSGNFTIGQVDDLDGTVVFTSAGNMLARDIEIATVNPGNDILLTTRAGGNITLNFVGTGLTTGTGHAVIGVIPPTYGNFIVHSAGNINAVAGGYLETNPSGSPINIVASNVELHATTGIGTPANLAPEMSATSLSANTVNGDMNLGNSSSTAFTLTSYTTGVGNLGFIMSGGGALHATDFVTQMGNVAITVHDHAYLFLGQVQAFGGVNGFGNVTLTNDHVTFVGGNGSVFGTGNLRILTDRANQYVEIDSHFAQTRFEADNTLEIGQIGFDAFLTDFKSVFIANPYISNYTYAYFDVEEPYLTDGLKSDTRIFLNDLQPTQTGESDEFRLSNLFAAINAAVAEGQFSDADVQALVDELEQSGVLDQAAFDGSVDDFLYSDDGAGAEDFGSADTGAQDATALVTAALASPAATSAPAHADDHSWIDRAVVATGAVAAVVVRPGQRPARRRFLGLF